MFFTLSVADAESSLAVDRWMMMMMMMMIDDDDRTLRSCQIQERERKRREGER